MVRDGSRWELFSEEQSLGRFERVLLTCPAPQALEESSSSDAGSAEPAEDPAVLAAAQTRLAASEAELAGLLEALAQTRRDVAETRRVVDDESKASVASSIGE